MALSSGSAPLPDFSARTRRDLWRALQGRDRPWDVLIVGGGIVGAGLLRQIILSGSKDALLVEKGDFASGTSGASSKLIHAGIRYLEQVWNHLKAGRLRAAYQNFRFVVQASAERKRLARLAPALVSAKPIHLVLGKGGGRSSWSVAAGCWLYYLIQLAQGQMFSPPRVWTTRADIERAFPELKADEVQSVYRFWDSETDDARLVIENLQDAHRRGASAMNYVELVSYDATTSPVRATLRDLETGETASVTARFLINATGAFVDEVARRGAGERHDSLWVDRVAGSHIDAYPALSERSFYVTASDGRLVFVLRRNEDGLIYSRIGTTERRLLPAEPSDRPNPTPPELEYLRALTATFFVDKPLDAARTVSADAGIRPLRTGEGDSAFERSREHDIIMEGRVVHVVGVKLTDYRRVAEEIVRTVDWRSGGVRLRRVRSDAVPLRMGGSLSMYAERDLETLVRQTMIVHWDDYVWRRRGLRPRLDAKANPAAFLAAFDEVSALLGWDAQRREREWRRFQ